MKSSNSPVSQSGENTTRPYYEDEYATVAFDESIPCVLLAFHGIPRYSEQYRLVQQKRLELIRIHKKNYPTLQLLTDSRTAGPVIEEDVAYFKSSVLPEIERVGIRFLAIVMPKNIFTRLTIDEMTGETRQLTVRYCQTMEEARTWLKRVAAE